MHNFQIITIAKQATFDFINGELNAAAEAYKKATQLNTLKTELELLRSKYFFWLSAMQIHIDPRDAKTLHEESIKMAQGYDLLNIQLN